MCRRDVRRKRTVSAARSNKQSISRTCASHRWFSIMSGMCLRRSVRRISLAADKRTCGVTSGIEPSGRNTGTMPPLQPALSESSRFRLSGFDVSGARVVFQSLLKT